jgi:exopolyphosphatase/guanosine-5'-triphosphate,3'-diphosphate pyrophosphatase
MSSGSVAIVDVGSNSIKVLVANRSPDGDITPLHNRTIDARISAGISKTEPRLTEEGMTRGIEAVRALLSDTVAFSPTRTIIVATSAVRGAKNGGEFRDRVHSATGHAIRILTGEEEASLIGLGLTADPALRTLQDFYVFDLGGGSLECLAFQTRTIQQAVSLPLGCVRLTEKFVSDVTKPLSLTERERVSACTRETLVQSAFIFDLRPAASAVGTGGTVTTVRTILGAREGKEFAATSSIVTTKQMRELLEWLGGMSLAERQRVPGLPPARADVFPVALATLLAVAEAGKFTAFQNSVYNLRYGLAAEALS